MTERNLIETFAVWRKTNDALVLATVVETDGSTYSKAGRHLLINSQGHYAGLVGGGCLEGDLVLHAAAVRESGTPQLISYDMRTEADDLWGMGSGCRGLMKLFMQRMDAANNWEPFAAIGAALASEDTHTLTLILATESPDYALGSCFSNDAQPELTPVQTPTTPTLIEHNTGNGKVTALHWRTTAWPRLLLLGAGPDATPLLKLALTMGWHVTIADHRPERLESPELANADCRATIEPDKLGETLDLGSFDAVVVMSHHLTTDLAYLRVLKNNEHAYVGVLGPIARRNELLKAMGETSSEFAKRLHGPIGFDIGADSPQSIALAIIAEIHAVLKQRPGGSLSTGTIAAKGAGHIL